MNWTDVYDIGAVLADTKPDIDPRFVRFTDLHAWIMAIEGFEGEADRSGEKVLEAIQAAWIDELD
jgi:FeS assembly protein IscX